MLPGRNHFGDAWQGLMTARKAVSIELGRRIGLPTFLFFGYNYIRWLVIAYIPIYMNDLGFSHFQIGALISAFPLSSLILTFPFGLFSDRLPPRRLVTLGLAIFALFLVGLQHLDKFWNLLPLFLLGGTGNSLFRISAQSVYFKFLGESRRSAKLGFYNAMRLLGYGLGPLTGGYLLENMDMASLFGIALLMISPLVPLSFLLERVEPIKFKLVEYRKDILRKEVLVLIALTFLVALHLGAEQTSLSLFLENYIGLEWSSIGHMFFFIGLGISSMSMASGFLQDRFTAWGKSLAPFLYLGVFFSGLFNINLLFTSTFGTVLAVRLFHVFGDSTFMVSRDTAISRLFLSERIGGNLGLIQTVLTFGILCGSLISGAIPGYLYPFVLAGSLAILGIPFAWIARPDFKARDPE